MARRSPITVGEHTYTAQDAHKTLGCIESLWREHLHATTVTDAWSALTREFVAEVASITGVALPSLDDAGAAVASLQSAVEARYAQLTDGQVGSVIAAMWRAYPAVRRLDRRHSGTVAHLHASKGLPKKAVPRAEIDLGGIVGDVQSSRAHHGRPWQALCIWTTDSIERLRTEGHPIGPGFAGENITVDGIPNGALRPGATFRVGGVEGFVTGYAWPCKKNADWFARRDFMRMGHERGDDSRVYAIVTAPGRVEPGDAFELTTDR